MRSIIGRFCLLIVFTAAASGCRTTSNVSESKSVVDDKVRYTGQPSTMTMEEGQAAEQSGMIRCEDAQGNKIACADLSKVEGGKCTSTHQNPDGSVMLGSCCTNDDHCGAFAGCYSRSRSCSFFYPGYCEL